ncbi:MAG TPA: GH1 family beta-glucosidase [Acidimicrobiia bacterium]|nr:GH1 family beta-glucosidase [Acidimicrobiia bacterium]
MPLPPDFHWGVSTSAYQIEGGRTDGKGDSIWDTLSDSGGLPDRGDVTCDHYHRWEEDVELMAELGIDAYRFSLAWTRLLPDGTGSVNQKGIEFYGRLIDSLLEHGITPWVTLFHWDLPQALQDRGGWSVRETASAFAEYAGIVGEVFGDRVKNWITHNEPWVATMLGHVEGIFAPGVKDWNLALRAGHHILLSHGLAVERLRSSNPEFSIGIALDCRPSFPASDREKDVAANRHFDGFRNRWFFDPVFGRGYPADIVEAYQARGRLPGLDFIAEDDLATIAAPIDFLGLNYYTSIAIAAGGEESEDTGVPPGANPPEGYTEMGWAITPEALTGFLGRVEQEYSPATIVITENGASYSDGPEAGRIADHRRIEYLEAHIRAVEEAVAARVSVSGYFVWSLLDNLEWTSGFSQRFGLVHVDHATGTRTPKDSFDWYRRLILRMRNA